MSTPEQENGDYHEQDAEPTMTAPGDERSSGIVADEETDEDADQ